MAHYDRKRIGLYLKKQRTMLGLSQKEVAKRIGLQSSQFISNIERGICATPLEVLRKFLDIYKQDGKIIVDLMTRSYAHNLKRILLRR